MRRERHDGTSFLVFDISLYRNSAVILLVEVVVGKDTSKQRFPQAGNGGNK